MGATRQLKMPEALEPARIAIEQVENEVDDVLKTMQTWPIVADAVLAWANSLTSTNCGWGTYKLAKLIVERWQAIQRRSV